MIINSDEEVWKEESHDGRRTSAPQSHYKHDHSESERRQHAGHRVKVAIVENVADYVIALNTKPKRTLDPSNAS
jgi:hypothetical protein